MVSKNISEKNNKLQINYEIYNYFTTYQKTDVLLYPEVPTMVGYLSLFRNKKVVLFCDT